MVEFAKLKPPVLGAAGVVDTDGADEEALLFDEDAPNRPVPNCLPGITNNPPGCEGVAALLSVGKLLVTGVDAPAPSSFFGPKLKPVDPRPPPNVLPDAFVGPKRLPV